MASQVIQIDFTQPLPTLRIHRRGELLLLVKFGLQPIGWVRIDSQRFGRTIAPTILGQIIAEALSCQILDAARIRAFEISRHGQSLSFSIVITPQTASPSLDRLLQSIALLDYPRFEVIVVDRPANDSHATICARFPFVRRVVDPRPGLAYARNIGWQVARQDIVVYVDPETTVDRSFLTALADQFADARINGVAANRLPTNLNAGASHHVSEYRLLDDILTRRVFTPGAWNAKVWIDLARAAASNALAIRRTTLAAMNGFDPAIKHGQSFDLFTRILRDGGHVAIEPRAIMLEQSRTTLGTIGRNAFDFGYSLAECCNKYFDDPELANVAALTLQRWTRDRFDANTPLSIGLLQTAGALLANRAYRRSLRRVRRETIRFAQRALIRRAA